MWLGTQTHITRTWTWLKSCLGLEPMWLELKPSQNPWYLVSGPNEAQIFDISSQKEFSEKSDRWEVDLFRFREKHTSRTECGPLQRARALASKCGVVSFYGLGNVMRWVGGLFQLFWGIDGDSQEFGHHPLFGLLTVSWNCHGASGGVISLVDQGLRFSRNWLVCHLGSIWF